MGMFEEIQILSQTVKTRGRPVTILTSRPSSKRLFEQLGRGLHGLPGSYHI